MSMPPTRLAKPAAVVYAKDLAPMAAFYAAVTDMALTHQAADHVLRESPAFELVLVAMPAAVAEGVTVTRPPERRTDTPIKLVFATDSITRVRAQAAALGGELNPPEREWAWNGQRSCDGHDPEGNVLQFRQPDA
jgi:predicted enzyme related to lactoylglutathione lyase